MKNNWHKLEQYRVVAGEYASNPRDKFGLFVIPRDGHILRMIASAGMEDVPWEHVSVSLANRCPTWAEMQFVKDMFWREDEVVMQLHVAAKDHINIHPYTLHLWKPINHTIPLPPKVAV